MAVRITDQLADLIGTDAASTRIESLAWLVAAQKDQFLLNFNRETNSQSLRSAIAQKLLYHPDIATFLAYHLKNSLIANHHLNWITGNKRQLNWIKKYIYTWIANNNNTFGPTAFPQFLQNQRSNQKTLQMPFEIPEFLTHQDQGIAMFDYFASKISINYDQIVNTNNQMQIAWSQQSDFEKAFEWINDEDMIQKTTIFKDNATSRSFESTHPHPQIYDQDDFLIYLDSLNASNFEKLSINREVRSRWNQQKRRERDKKSKKQCNFILSTEVDSKLSKLAKKHYLKRVDIIEILIHSESSQGSYIKAWLDRLPKNSAHE